MGDLTLDRRIRIVDSPPRHRGPGHRRRAPRNPYRDTAAAAFGVRAGGSRRRARESPRDRAFVVGEAVRILVGVVGIAVGAGIVGICAGGFVQADLDAGPALLLAPESPSTLRLRPLLPRTTQEGMPGREKGGGPGEGEVTYSLVRILQLLLREGLPGLPLIAAVAPEFIALLALAGQTDHPLVASGEGVGVARAAVADALFERELLGGGEGGEILGGGAGAAGEPVRAVRRLVSLGALRRLVEEGSQGRRSMGLTSRGARCCRRLQGCGGASGRFGGPSWLVLGAEWPCSAAWFQGQGWDLIVLAAHSRMSVSPLASRAPRMKDVPVSVMMLFQRED